MSVDALREKIRNRIIGEMHLGHRRPGDRLPSVRALAQEFGADHRAAAAAYRQLEQEGLVEMRGRAGVYLARQEQLGGELVSETASWLADVLGEARRRRIALTEFADFVRSCLGRVRLRCACVESNADASVSMRMELEEEFGVETVAVLADSLPGPDDPEDVGFPESIRTCDFLVSTAFHAGAVRQLAARLGKPFALITMPEEMSGIIEERIQSAGLTVIVSDLRYGERFRSMFPAAPAEAVRVVLAEHRQVIGRLSRAEPVLATRAARHLLPDLDLPLLLPRFPSISPKSTREISAIMIRLNMERSRAESAAHHATHGSHDAVGPVW